MTIAIIVEGKTEKAFLSSLREFLELRLAGKMPRLDPFPRDGRIPKGDELRRVVLNLIAGGADYVIALTDVYTGSREFEDASDAKEKMRLWVGIEDRFFAHAAQYEFEAWLLPYWSRLQELAGKKRSRPGGNPEQVNHDKPPSQHIKDLFRHGKRDYVKGRDVQRILKGQDLAVAAKECPELRAFLNTILQLCGGPLV